MTLSERYAEALLPDRIRILGRTLHPYCIGHALLLHRIGSPFVSPSSPLSGERTEERGPESGVGDLLLALWILSRPWQQAAAGLRKRRTRWLLNLWGWQLRQLNSDLALFHAQCQIQECLGRAWDGPDLWEEQAAKTNRKSGAPVLASLKVMLCGIFKCSEDQALSTPIRVALFDTAAWAETQGAIQWVNEDELSDIDEALRHGAKNHNQDGWIFG
jgi:hypothetical protein